MLAPGKGTVTPADGSDTGGIPDLTRWRITGITAVCFLVSLGVIQQYIHNQLREPRQGIGMLLRSLASTITWYANLSVMCAASYWYLAVLRIDLSPAGHQ